MVRAVGPPHVIYLHGLGSSPDSVKARLVSGWCAELGVPVSVPSLSLPSFERLSVDAVISHVTELVKGVPFQQSVVLVGSSFGGFVALHSFDRLSEDERGRVKGLFLMAPVFYPWHRTRGLLTPEVERSWQTQGAFPLSESASGRDVLVHYKFIEELRRYSSDVVPLSVPTMVVHGTRDQTVSHEQSEEFALKREGVRLVLLDDDHQLVARPDHLKELLQQFIAATR